MVPPGEGRGLSFGQALKTATLASLQASSGPQFPPRVCSPRTPSHRLSRPSIYSFFFFRLSWADCLFRIFRRIFFSTRSSYCRVTWEAGSVRLEGLLCCLDPTTSPYFLLTGGTSDPDTWGQSPDDFKTSFPAPKFWQFPGGSWALVIPGSISSQ